MFVPESLEDESTKGDFATKARLMCIAHAATAAVMTPEAWARFAKPNEKFDETEPPSEAFDHREIAVLMGEAPGVQKNKFLPIIRSGNGKFFGSPAIHPRALFHRPAAQQDRFEDVFPSTTNPYVTTAFVGAFAQHRHLSRK